MPRIGRACLVFLVIASFLLSGCVAKSEYEKVQGDLTASQSQLQTAQNDLSALKTDHDSLTSDYEALKAEHEKLQADLDKLQGEFDTLSRDKQAVDDQLKAAEAKLSTAELGKKSAETSLDALKTRVDKARTKAEILDLIFGLASKTLFGRSVTTRSEQADLGIKLTMLVAEADDATLDQKFTEMINKPNDQKTVIDFFVYMISDLYAQLK